MFNKVYLGNKFVNKIYLGSSLVKYNTDSVLPPIRDVLIFSGADDGFFKQYSKELIELKAINGLSGNPTTSIANDAFVYLSDSIGKVYKIDSDDLQINASSQPYTASILDMTLTNEKRLYTISQSDGQVKELNSNNLQVVKSYSVNGEAICSDAEGNIYVATSGTLFKFNSGLELIGQLSTHANPRMKSLCIDNKGFGYLSNGRKKIVKFNTANMTSVKEVSCTNYELPNIWLPNGFVYLGDGQYLTKINADTMTVVSYGQQINSDILDLTCDSEGMLYTSNADGSITKFNPDTMQILKTIKPHTGKVNTICSA